MRAYRLPRVSYLVGFLACTFAARGQLPQGFVEKVFAPNASFNEATSMAHADDGSIFVSERAGKIWMIKGDGAVVIDSVKTTTDREQGLLKIQVHPNFVQKRWIYIYYLTPDANHHNVTRLFLNAQNAVIKRDTVIKLPLLENGGRHNGSGMVFGKDGFLYVSRGQDELGGAANPAGLWTSQKGKILRFTEEGLPAPGNPHYNTAGASEGEKSIWARGFRNPWTLAYDPYSGRILEGDVGDGTEELNDVTTPDPAKDYWYGYGVGGGDGVNAGGKNNTIDPIYYHGTGADGECAIVAEVPYNSAMPSNWPAEYKNKIYVADYCGSNIKMVPLNNPAKAADINNAAVSGMKLFYDNSKKKVCLNLGMDGNLYYVEYGGNRKAYMIYNTAAAGVRQETMNQLGVSGLGIKVGAMSDIKVNLMGEYSLQDIGAASFTIQGMNGKTLFQKPVKIGGGALTVEGFQPKLSGLFVCRLTWSSQGQSRVALGRLIVLP